MKKTIVKYALLHKASGTILGFTTSSNHGAEFSNDTSYYLEKDSDQQWLVVSPEQAEYVRLNNTPWYNAGYNTPVNNFKPNELEVVKLVQTIASKPVKVKFPTVKTVLKAKFAKGGYYENERDWQHMQNLMLGKEPLKLSFYDYVEYYEKCKGKILKSSTTD